MAPRVRTEDLVDAQVVAEILGLSHRNSVYTYLRRYPSMPRPILDIGEGRVQLWLRPEVEAWARARSNKARRTI
jgi:predicted DNA-binding transcriptional regulator AlpA